MIKEQTIYVTEDGIRFDNRHNAENHEEIYSRLLFDEEKWLGDRLIYPGIGGGYCLETKQHKQSDLIQVAMDIITLLNTHCIMNEDDYNIDRWFNPCLKMITEIQSSKDIEEQIKTWNMLTDYIYRYSRWYYYKTESWETNTNLEKCILNKIANRLNNTSWKTGIEYPECGSYSRKWRLRESEWEDFVIDEKKYIGEGGKYR